LREAEERVVREEASDDKDEVEIARVEPLLDIGLVIVVVRSIVDGVGAVGLSPPAGVIGSRDHVGDAGKINRVW